MYDVFTFIFLNREVIWKLFSWIILSIEFVRQYDDVINSRAQMRSKTSLTICLNIGCVYIVVVEAWSSRSCWYKLNELLELGDLVDVCLHRLFLSLLALDGIPGIPLGLAGLSLTFRTIFYETISQNDIRRTLKLNLKFRILIKLFCEVIMKQYTLFES